jgi:23S rRNA-/tRNA-specific pseudouridylate synthase
LGKWIWTISNDRNTTDYDEYGSGFYGTSVMSHSISLLISGNDTGQRVDKFLRKYLPNAPLAVIFKSLRTGKIKVSGKKVEQSYKLEEGDTLTFFFSEEDMSQFRKEEKKDLIL